VDEGNRLNDELERRVPTGPRSCAPSTKAFGRNAERERIQTALRTSEAA
jgi:hypothetical protein